MKHLENIEMAIKMVGENTANLSGMKYEQGVIDALEWVLGLRLCCKRSADSTNKLVMSWGPF